MIEAYLVSSLHYTPFIETKQQKSWNLLTKEITDMKLQILPFLLKLFTIPPFSTATVASAAKF